MNSHAATISGVRLLLGLQYVRAATKHTCFALGDPKLNRDGLIHDGFKPDARALGILFEGEVGGRPLAECWAKLFQWAGHPDEPILFIDFLGLAKSGLDQTSFSIDEVVNRIRVPAGGEAVLRRFLCQLAQNDIRRTDLQLDG